MGPLPPYSSFLEGRIIIEGRIYRLVFFLAGIPNPRAPFLGLRVYFVLVEVKMPWTGGSVFQFILWCDVKSNFLIFSVELQIQTATTMRNTDRPTNQLRPSVRERAF